MTTKRQIIAKAYTSAGLASYAFDLSAEEVASALMSLDAMMAQWNVRGARIGYTMGGDPDTDATVPDWALEAMWLNLGIRLAGEIGKQMMPETKSAAKQAYTSLLGMVAAPPDRQLDRMLVPSGAGNRPSYDRNSILLPQPIPDLSTGQDGDLDLG